MKKQIQLITGLLLSFLIAVVSGYAIAQTLTHDENDTVETEVYMKMSLVEWVKENAKRPLPLESATFIIDKVYEVAKEHSIDPLLILSVMHVESEFHPKAQSTHGAKGLMQVVPYWHKDKLKGRNPLKMAVSIEVGTRVLHDCLVRAKDNVNRALICYNGGGDKKYQMKVAKSHKRVSAHLIAQRFDKELPIASVGNFHKGRVQFPSNNALVLADAKY